MSYEETPGLTPEYDCCGTAILVLVVEAQNPNTPIWAIRSQAGIDLPVQHGSSPSGAEVLVSGDLSAGTAYRVVISRPGGATFFKEFVP